MGQLIKFHANHAQNLYLLYLIILWKGIYNHVLLLYLTYYQLCTLIQNHKNALEVSVMLKTLLHRQTLWLSGLEY